MTLWGRLVACVPSRTRRNSNERRGGVQLRRRLQAGPTIAIALILGSCSTHQTPSKPAAATQQPRAAKIPQYRGNTTVAGLSATVSVTKEGEYSVYFMDAAGDDLPAAALSSVSLNNAPLQINDTGETWVGNAAPSAKAHLALTYKGASSSVDVALDPVNVPLDYVCPMDPDIRSATAGNCSRCGMKLVLGIPDPEEYPVDLEVAPSTFRPNENVQLVFKISDPHTNKPVKKFEIVHERLFHLFIVSSDLKYFVHDHPKFSPGGEFRYDTKFPKPGMYRTLADFYPSAGTPQLAPKTIFVPGEGVSLEETKLTPDLAPQKSKNTEVELLIGHPEAGSSSQLIFRVKPADGLQKYLGAWAHMLIASDDTIDLLHEHPTTADGGQDLSFDLTFPRPRVYRIWVQFQRQGVVNTVAFNVAVQPPSAAQK
jgi:hypothetical protein